jgi:hypothetical protein
MFRSQNVLAISAVNMLTLALWSETWRQPMKAEDEKLVKKVREAVSKKTPPEMVEEFVGIKATIHTLRAADRLALPEIDIAKDPEEPGPTLDLKQAKNVAYWVGPIQSRDARIIGIVWTTKDEMHVFYGIVLPPG